MESISKKKNPELLATRIPPGSRGLFTEEPFKVLPGNKIYEEPFDPLEDDSVALVAMELGLIGKDPVEILIAAEENDLEAVLSGLEIVGEPGGSLASLSSDKEADALIAKFSQPRMLETVRRSRPVLYKVEPPKPATGCVAPICYDREAHKHVLGREAKVVVRKHHHYVVPNAA
ncbi:MAG: hypothetical protein A2942_05065 [Candidatus Lloydbacteria bacterium RIFCSPLOWO2_01_FULL_50_20]|uniref:Uncharacterized protein n=1 Tax=Candidatus Lloydbacteria bacterium RIFCSPLOWO2_01_FULL_50_20 TaxID=1798665 RepID=A0A1G2DCK2_9BACT|nr:MAG: hypothetical protein A3C13_01450 [Candidatus Lloydbacteria bacterium RIFCSPHIGHO2_02_FULL_50_11]OGZ11142.1 MAG: hypothetical protein A2942_05065 [Candidatus Lloydbacteria bacterium RIFCSPLOWO2_01_FULL_50_20]